MRVLIVDDEPPARDRLRQLLADTGEHEVAGEAASQLGEETKADYPEVPWRELIATRVILAHAYHRVDLDLLWDIAADDLPKLASALGPITEGPRT